MTVTGRASWYPTTRGYSGIPAVALPGAWYRPRGTSVRHVEVCAESRCVVVPVVDFCDCYVGTRHARIADLSSALINRLRLSLWTGIYTIRMRLLE